MTVRQEDVGMNERKEKREKKEKKRRKGKL